ncbi:sensor histidine kinase [Cohnella hashimotonis]|uniref:Signal transduction histidine-protein kinase/phosphatase MprB n=1 Tax=Cohnella hashimotonis TaxID=2826895 RepID=A0ABT6TVJ0_9BACL|nr:HAMP domain-containing sensor histidine kinase [Cohnella hashimotonis]MDI4649812.1 HAMP domain-containing sensor histidine kinase [Cohnella hashimotonis]
MRRVRIRGFLALALLTVLTLSWTTYMIAAIAETGSLHLGEGRPSRAGIWIAALAGALLAAVFLGYGLRRWIVKPLEAMGRGAREIAGGDLDVALPDSRIREIAEVRDGFEAMVAGLRQSLADREALEEERRFFIGAIAHDLRTPLFALRGYLEGLEQGIAASPEQAKKYVTVCQDKAGQLDRLVSDLFAFVKTEYPLTAHAGDSLDLGEEVRRAVEGVRGAAHAKEISVVAEPPGNGPILVRGDAHQLSRAFGNLLDNAVRHTPPQGTVVVRCRPEGERILVIVMDTGSGFAPEDLSRVFEPLYRGESSRSRDTGGAGLGLAIARRIFRAHGGDLIAANRPGGGAELAGWIPRVRDW